MVLLRTEYYGEDSRAASPFGGIAMKKMVYVLLSYAILIGALPYNKSHNSHPEIPQDAQFSEAATDLHTVPENDENRGASKRNVAPGSYDSILQTYRKIVDLAPDLAEEKELCSEAIRSACSIGEPGMDPFIRLAASVINLYPKSVEGWKPNGSSDFGYAIKDINRDGSVELILLRADGTIVAVFTMHDQKPVLLDAFQNRYRCSLSDSGEIFTSGSNGAARTVNRKYSLDPATGQLLLICEFGTDGFDPVTGETSFYMDVNTTKTNLTEAEYTRICKENPALSPAQLLEFLTYRLLF